jgi:hypothetical protein
MTTSKSSRGLHDASLNDTPLVNSSVLVQGSAGIGFRLHGRIEAFLLPEMKGIYDHVPVSEIQVRWIHGWINMVLRANTLYS